MSEPPWDRPVPPPWQSLFRTGLPALFRTGLPVSSPSAPGLHALKREDARWWLAIGTGIAFVCALGGILGMCLAGGISDATARDLAATFLTLLLTLAAAVFGFYYGGGD
jgi:hypothetical protein